MADIAPTRIHAGMNTHIGSGTGTSFISTHPQPKSETREVGQLLRAELECAIRVVEVGQEPLLDSA